jgi:hypothetical protein
LIIISLEEPILLNNEQNVVYYYYTWEPERLLKTPEIILLVEKEGKLIRQTTPLEVGTNKFFFKPLTNSTLDSFEKGFLYDYLFNPSAKKSVNYFQPFKN